MTSNRSDWSKLRSVARELISIPGFDVVVVAVGSHLLQEFGHTVDEVKNDCPNVIEVSTTVAGDAASAMVDSVGFGIIKISQALVQLKPDVCVIHGDRFEAFAAATAANLLNVAVAHIEGGELSGTVDGYIRHAISKLSHIHFASSEDAAYRIRAMGEDNDYVFVTGCPSYERLFAIDESAWENVAVSEKFPGLSRRKFILALMHPCVTDLHQSVRNYENLMSALFELKIKTVFLYPNIDPGNKRMIQILHKYQKTHTDWPSWLIVQNHMPPKVFAVLMRESAVMLGNSSAGIRETCVFGTPTLNIGSRQLGRLQPLNVTTFEDPPREAITRWIVDHFSTRFPSSSEFGSPQSPTLIAHKLASVDLNACRRKLFHEYEYLVRRSPPIERSSSRKISSTHFPRVLGIITARGGSKGIPGKNIANLGGKPLINYTIEAARSSKLLERFVLTTDCPAIAKIAAEAGCEVPFMRPEHLARDDSPHIECIQHAVSTLLELERYQAEYIMILQPTSPFRVSEDIDGAIMLAAETQCDAVVSVSRANLSLSKTFFINDQTQHAIPYALNFPTKTYIRRQDQPTVYSENGAIFLQRTDSVMNPCHIRTGSLFTKDLRAYVMPVERSLDVDEPHDLVMAQALISLRHTDK